MRVLAPVIEGAALPVFHPGEALPFGRAVALQLLGDDDLRYVLQLLGKLRENLLRRRCVAGALHEDIEESREMLGIKEQLRSTGLDHSPATRTRRPLVCVSNFSSSCAAMR